MSDIWSIIKNGKEKLEKKHLDLIAANNLKDPGAGFGVSTNLRGSVVRGGVRDASTARGNVPR